MKHWTEKQQSALDTLQADKTRAESRLREDIDALPDLGDPESDIGSDAVRYFLFEHGQAILDMLLVHFDPSPFVSKTDVPAPNEFAPLPIKQLTDVEHSAALDHYNDLKFS